MKNIFRNLSNFIQWYFTEEETTRNWRTEMDEWQKNNPSKPKLITNDYSKTKRNAALFGGYTTEGVKQAMNTLSNPKVTLNPFDAASPDTEMVTHANGAKESKTKSRFDLLPAFEVATIAQILGAGAVKYGENNWHGISTASHLNHALQHVFAYMFGDRSDDHLGHAATRLLFAMWKENNKDII
jgi:Domain of unknown function (DUF5664)